MEVIVLLISVSLLLASIFLGAFIWAQVNGQYEDDQSPAVRMLMDDDQTISSNNRTKQ